MSYGYIPVHLQSVKLFAHYASFVTHNGFFGEPRWIRTNDPRLKRALLYQLS